MPSRGRRGDPVPAGVPGRCRVAACVLVLGCVAGWPLGLVAQESVLESWTLGYLSGGWAPRWRAPTTLGSVDAEPGPERIGVQFRAAGLGLRSAWDQSESAAHVSVRQPVSRSLALRASATSGTWRTDADGRTLVETPRSEAVAAGVDAEESLGSLGRLRMSVLAGWDAGAGGEGRLSLGNARYRVGVAGWRVRGRASRVLLPADSLRDLGATQLSSGAEASARAEVRLRGVWLRPTARWRTERLDARDASPETFFTTSPAGDARLWQVGLEAGAGAWWAGGAYRSRKVDLESTLLRSGVQAGRLFFARVELTRWSAAVGRYVGPSLWTLGLDREVSDGTLSTRIETWPFTDIWGQLTTQAYRLRGRMAAQSWIVRIAQAQQGAAAWRWSLELGRYRVRADRDSWFVTSFGFGRADRERTTAGVDPATVIGVHVGRAIALGPGAADVSVMAGAPVAAEELGGAPTPGGGVAGYAGVTLAWRW